MPIQSIFFYLFSSLLLFAAFRVITARNPVHSALYLVLAFFQASGLWMLLNAEFLSITLVLVYVGAVMVLFLFVVMMLDIKLDALRQGFWRYFPLGAFLGVLVALELAAVLMVGFRDIELPPSVSISNTQALGKLLYTEYIYPVELAAAILLVAMIAAIVLTLRERKDSKHQDPSLQVRVRASDRVRLVKISTGRPTPPPDASAPSTPNTGDSS